MKKLLSTIMALVMLLSLVPMAVAEEGGTTRWSETLTENSVAQVGNTYYEVLYDAVAAVEAGGTVTLVRNATGGGVGTYTTAGKDNLGRDKIVAKSFTLDFAGYTYTVSEPAVGSKGYESQGFHLEQGDGNVSVTLKNGTLASTGSAVKMLVQNYCNLTLDNMTLDGTGYTNKYFSNGDYVLSNNCGNVTIKDTTIVARDGDFAFDVYGGFQKYSDVTVTVTGNSVINGKVELARDNTDNKNENKLVIDGGTINGQICNTSGTVVVKSGAFTDLASAVKYATDGATITLAGDVKGDIVIPAGKTITLDLGGHKLTNVKEHTIVNNGTLTITGTGTVDNVTHGKAALYNTGTATLNGGTFERSAEAGVDSKNNGGNSFYTILNHGLMTVDEGVVVNNKGHYSSLFENGYYNYKNQDGVENPGLKINGGTFDGGLNTIKNDDNATLVINNGTFKNYTQACVQNHHVAEINGGEYIGNKAAAVLMCGVCKTVDETHDRHVMSITDGNFKGALTVTVGKLTIKGGTFTTDPSAFVTDTNLVVVPNVGKTDFTVQPKTSEDGKTTTEVSADGKTVTETTTDGNTVTKTETNLETGKSTVTKTETKTETKKDGNVETETTTVTNTKTEDGKVTEDTETVTTKRTENGATTTVKTTKDNVKKTTTTEVTDVTAPATEADVKLDVKDTSSVAVDKAAMTALTNEKVKDVIIETKQATLKLDKTAVKTMEGKVAADGKDKMTLNVKVTEEKNASKTEIEKIMVEVTAVNEAGQNMFPKDTEKTNGKITITILYTGTATQLDLWYTTDSGSIYMGRFPVVNGFVSFDVKHFSRYDLLPVASSGSSVASGSSSSGTHTVTTDLTPGSITKVTVDGKVVDAKYYTVSGSNVIFTAEFLKTLKNGSHTVTVENATRIAKGVFTVNNPVGGAKAPTTADAGIALYAGMAIASVMGTGVVFTSRKRKNH